MQPTPSSRSAAASRAAGDRRLTLTIRGLDVPPPAADLRARPYHYQGIEVDFSARRARLHGDELALTEREYEVLGYFARNACKILLQRLVWGGHAAA